MDITRTVRSLMEVNNMNQQALADAMGYTHSNVSYMLKNQNFKPSHIEKLAEVFQMAPMEFMFMLVVDEIIDTKFFPRPIVAKLWNNDIIFSVVVEHEEEPSNETN